MSKGEINFPHVLIVDDNPDQVRFLISALRNAPYRVSIALNGDQGYARATALLPDLILLDVRMPGRDGIVIARLLKTNPSTRHIPIIFLSALTDQRERVAGLRAGGVDYIDKPFSIDEILERIRIHLALARRRIPSAREDERIDHADGNKALPNPLPANLTLKKMAIEFILNNIQARSLKTSDIASNLEVSTRRLNAVFEAHGGISPFEFIRRERMRRAALILGQTTLPVADVAIEVGYDNPANFATEFKKFWGKTPTKFRSESQTDPEALKNLISSKFD